jgi:hypothetical protein
MTRDRGRASWRWLLWAARVIIAAGLAVDAYVHLDLASLYAEAGGTVNEGVLFRAEAVAAMLTAVVVIATGRRAAYLAGLAVAGSALAAMLISRYADLGQIGPLPVLYDPVWFPEKVLAAAAEGAAAGAALAAVITILAARASRTRPGPAGNRSANQVGGVSR